MAETGTSILNSMKKMLGIDESYDVFDTDITVHINTVFSVLHSIGASPPDGFVIFGPEETWEQFLENRKHVEMVKSYMYLKIRLVFDTPTTSIAADAFKKQADEYEWRLSTMELTFNPDAYGPSGTSAVITVLEPNGDFPEGTPDDTVGIDPITGDVWQEV
jgi:hypothetical protein